MVSSSLIFSSVGHFVQNHLFIQILQPPTLEEWDSMLSQQMEEFYNYFQFVLGFIILFFLIKGLRG